MTYRLFPVGHVPRFADGGTTDVDPLGYPSAEATGTALGKIGEAWRSLGPSWAEQAAQFAGRDPKELLTDPAYTQFAMGMMGPATTKAVGALTPEAAAATKGITAYHGSPHDFERFDLSKIGTGEGAQAYGHGLYFAEHPETAESYKQALAGKSADQAEQLALQALRTEGNPKQAVASLRQRAAAEQRDPFSGIDPADMHRAADKLEGGWLPNKGKMYQVNINANPEHFLDWDKPLSEQSEHVRERLGSSSETGAEHFAKMTWGQKGLEIDFSNMLSNKGIPGIRYLDQGSRIPRPELEASIANLKQRIAAVGAKPDPSTHLGRAAAEMHDQLRTLENLRDTGPTYNYVIFDDRLIDIIKKYGLAGLTAGGLGHFALQQTDTNPQFEESPRRASGGRVDRKARVNAILAKHGCSL